MSIVYLDAVLADPRGKHQSNYRNNILPMSWILKQSPDIAIRTAKEKGIGALVMILRGSECVGALTEICKEGEKEGVLIIPAAMTYYGKRNGLGVIGLYPEEVIESYRSGKLTRKTAYLVDLRNYSYLVPSLKKLDDIIGERKVIRLVEPLSKISSHVFTHMEKLDGAPTIYGSGAKTHYGITPATKLIMSSNEISREEIWDAIINGVSGTNSFPSIDIQCYIKSGMRYFNGLFGPMIIPHLRRLPNFLKK